MLFPAFMNNYRYPIWMYTTLIFIYILLENEILVNMPIYKSKTFLYNTMQNTSYFFISTKCILPLNCIKLYQFDLKHKKKS